MISAFINYRSRTNRSISTPRTGFTCSTPIAYAQPQINLSSLKLEGFEILARWKHPQQGLLHPAQVLPHIGFVQDLNILTEALLRQTLVQMHKHALPIPGCRISFNVTFAQLDDERFVERLCVISKQEMSNLTLVLEITEQAHCRLDQSQDRKQRELQRLIECGWQISLDDFGTGTSTYQRLCQLPVDEIKIERQFIDKLGSPGTREEIIVQHMTRLSADLEVDCVAEGIECAKQLLVLQALGCTRGQGYFFSPPMALQRLHRWCTNWQTASCREKLLEQLNRASGVSDPAYQS